VGSRCFTARIHSLAFAGLRLSRLNLCMAQRTM
jgi:hypothetical protein